MYEILRKFDDYFFPTQTQVSKNIVQKLQKVKKMIKRK